MNSFFKPPDERGQGLVEYALILVLVAIVVIGILLVLGPTVAQVYCQVSNGLEPGSCGVLERVDLIARTAAGVQVEVHVSEDTSLTVTNSHNTDVKNVSCATPSCTFSVNGLGLGSGTLTIVDGDGMTTVFHYPAN